MPRLKDNPMPRLTSQRALSVEALEPRPDAVERVLELMHQCETCTGYGDPETIRIFRGVARRIREAVYGSDSPPFSLSPIPVPPERPQLPSAASLRGLPSHPPSR
jgi:hypothetical protein